MSAFAFAEDRNASRKRTIIAGIKLFLDSVYGGMRQNHGYIPPEEKIEYEKLAKVYLADKSRDVYKDLINFRKIAKVSPRTSRNYLSGIKEFLEVGGIVLDIRQKKKIQAAFKGGNEAPEDAPDHMKIRSFIEHADIRMKAIVLLLSSSGMRIGELLSIREEDVNSSRHMITLKAQNTKTKTGRVVFFSAEAETALNQFLKVRSQYIAENNVKVEKLKKETQTIDDGRIFGYDPITINRAWRRTLKRANLYTKNSVGQAVFHPHALRQFFSTQMRKNGCPDSIVEVLIGHVPYLSTYIRYSPKELQDAYEKYSPVLEIGTDDMVRRTVESISETSTKHAEELTKIRKEKEALEARLQQLEKSQEEKASLEKMVEEMYRKFQEDKQKATG